MLNTNFNECPRCGGTYLDRAKAVAVFNEEFQIRTFEVECDSCGLEFEEFYKFIGSKFDDEEKTK